MRIEVPESKVLIFDIECRPTAWFGGDYVGKSITAAAWVWLDGDEPTSVVLDRDMDSTALIMEGIVEAVESADLVVGHFIRGFDLPVLAGELETLGWTPFDPVLTLDTKTDRLTTMGISESLENLVARYELTHAKIPMNEPRWSEHNLWQTPRSVEWVRERVEGDVVSTKELYLAMQDRLKGPKAWDPRGSKMPRYRA